MSQNFLQKKKVFLSVFIFATCLYYGQNFKMFTGPLASVDTSFQNLGKTVVGTPYLNVNFYSATIGDSPETVLIRYDAYSDKVEILMDEKVYEIPKKNELSTFKFKGMNNVTLIYLKEEDGYFFRLVDGKNQLLKKEKIKLQVVSPSIEPNSTIRDGYSKLERTNPTYFIKADDGKLIKIPKNNKELLNDFPERKADLENFIKTNKINIKQEDSMIKLVQFLNK